MCREWCSITDSSSTSRRRRGTRGLRSTYKSEELQCTRMKQNQKTDDNTAQRSNTHLTCQLKNPYTAQKAQKNTRSPLCYHIRLFCGIQSLG